MRESAAEDGPGNLVLAAKAGLFPLVLLTLMTYVVMPTVTRLLRRWL
ncbi:hypothetical protein HUO13_16095 [Saccharopolyspora erythraea]|nr:hypothetical protein [Saccharopolyspora erythraea]QUG99387.1 hypothetical protein HUO13_16095 [Saccharopolyspora erythraea]